MAVLVCSLFLKYLLLVIDNRLEGRWANKSTWMFYLEFTSDLVRLFLYVIFFGALCHFYGLPIHMMRELYLTFHNLRERISKFIHYRRITHNMNERFPDATPEEIRAADPTCIICREDMTTAKR
jgi:E3 ubiquitin-protein ligase synoviolin